LPPEDTPRQERGLLSPPNEGASGEVLGTPSSRTSVYIAPSSPEEVVGHLRMIDGKEGQPWLTFDAEVMGRPVRVFADSGASHRYMSKRVADRLHLQIAPQKGMINLEGGKRIPLLGSVRVTWHKGRFSETSEFMVLSMEHDVILGQDFWVQYRAVPDYDSYGLRVLVEGEAIVLCGLGRQMQLRVLQSEYDGVQLPLMVGGRTITHGLTTGYFTDTFLYIVRKRPEYREVPIEHPTTGIPELDRELGELLKVLRTDLTDEPPPSRWADHKIELLPGARPVNRSPFSLSTSQIQEQTRQIEYLYARGMVQPSISPWGAPVLFAKKKDGTWRMCIDYRALNSLTVRNGYPLPKIQDCLDVIGNAKYFTKIDLTSGYWQIAVAPEDREKTAFNTRTGKWEFCVMPFGLTNAPATFQALMNETLRPYLDKFVVVYLDDILIFSRTKEEHYKHVQMVFEKLAAEKLYAKPAKCVFATQDVEFCGHTIRNGRVYLDNGKVRTIQEWPVPKTVHDVRSFMGLCSYYRRFVKNFAHIAGPLYDLIEGPERNKQVEWHAGCELAFQALKTVITSDLVLIQPDTQREFIIETDASDFGWGAVLLQVASYDGKEHPVAFESKKFTSAECNYPTHERELLAIKNALRKWKCYVENGLTTTVRTDHAGLQYLKTTTTASGRLARWLAEFGEYNLDIRYKPGTEMTVADALSRRQDYKLRTMNTAFEKAVENYFSNGSLPKDKDELAELREHLPNLAKDDNTEGIVRYTDPYTARSAPFVPVWGRADLLNHLHREYGHIGELPMTDLLRTRGWWPQVTKDIRHYVSYCKECQLAARPRDKRRDVQHPSHEWQETRTQPFECWGLDLIGMLPKTANGNRWIITAIDYATGWAEAEAVPEATAEVLAEFVRRRIYRQYGAPREIITDRGINLWAPAMEQLFKRLRSKHRGTTIYHPRTNGMVERLNGVLGAMLTKYLVNEPINHWDHYLDQALFATRIRTHSTKGFSPFYLLYGVHPHLLGDDSGPSPEHLDSILREDPAILLAKDRADALNRTIEKANKNKEEWAKHLTKHDPKFKAGDWVVIRTKEPKK
jgi:transposase InsO family protein